ncbi:DUF1302 family protein [Marinobacter orientalis]|uniref:Uncharacterized protein n=1 Tax=Marinobacter orientalis TaxID=1928859 RepID=A0A7Y0NJP2_9GAMM|nr:DUF1302 family protein [Marinobacter orientalis]NMT62705.1 hypothetical protein [Marinobacter orientalis]TGX51390.1 hypothetical protein DIT72_05015 [Marinobacter orientalis]
MASAPSRRLIRGIAAIVLPLASGYPGYVSAVEVGNFTVNGYLRQYLSWNLDDVSATAEDDKWDMSMARTTALLQARGEVGPARVTAIGRASYEYMTDYMDRLEDLTEVTGVRADFQDELNELDVRELYADFRPTDRIFLRLGKQQVVWGETDFFQAMDVVHGYDQSWRSFLEPENEEWRKPLILANATIDIPEMSGQLQLLVRPGLDDEEDIGNTYDLYGGRWAGKGNRGFNLKGTVLPIDYNNDEGDADDPHYGFRWSGTLGEYDGLAYSVNYYHTQGQDPVVFPTEKANAPIGAAFVYPEIDIVGGTLSGYIAPIDSVFRAELAYTPDKPYNNPAGGVVEKDTYRMMFGLDTNLRLQNTLGTSSPSMLSLQVFNTYLDNHTQDISSPEAVQNAFGTVEDEHTTWLTAIFTLPYKYDSVVGQLVAVHDASNGGGVLVPSVEFAFGQHWRLKTELDLFYGGDKSPADGTSLFGSFDESDQLYTRITYQF